MTTNDDARTVPGDGFVQSLARGLTVIAAFDAEHPVMSFTEVARRTDLTRATARRFLLTLETLGYVRSDGRGFELTPKVLGLGHAYLSALSLPQLAQPHLRALSAELGESTSLSVLDGSDIVYVARVATKSIMSVSIAVGTRLPAYATSMGRVLLAGLPPRELMARLEAVEPRPLTERTLTDREQLGAQIAAVRRAGWAVVDQELELGLRSVAVPVTDAQGTVVAAVNASVRVSLGTGDVESLDERVVPALQRCARALSADVAISGHTGFLSSGGS